MRVDPDLVYDDYKDRVEAAFHLLEKKICETVRLLVDDKVDRPEM